MFPAPGHHRGLSGVANPIRLSVFLSVAWRVLLWDVMGFNPREIARAGRKVYERHRAELERCHHERYVLIDVKTEKLFLAESPDAAYQQAAAERGPFPLIRIGDRAAFRSRRLPNRDELYPYVHV